ncbi:flagellar export chaperone FliS [Stakelama tenebrarum]|uniref:Flagellar secretion chaperone FliS n=1 Tax=Stakelama tenebrarum TaxID=2711215 RepID=A0A6G6Y1D3_9SPHN|nr:flagellar protein FliS [Sphingosinithalassobacter tenebrarum]QIG78735.1 flagellar protein FliS [Sphingosinithalassobacter tenebrarum]
MVRYASPLAASPAETYRRIDIAGRTGEADPHRLVELLYEEGIAALRAAAHAMEQRQPGIRNDRISRATAILFALEAGLDFEQGGDISRTLATFYHGVRQQVLAASTGNDPAPLRDAAESLAEIAGAWGSVRAG